MGKLTWLVTGCSSGFGEELSKSLLKRGDNVIATARGGVERLNKLRNLGAATLSLDVSESQLKLDKIVETALAIYGKIDVLVNNAGYIEASLLEEATHERLLASLNTNLFGGINLTRAILPTMRARKSGTIVWVGSCGGWQGEIGAGLYCASKFGMEGVVECWQKETAFFGIKQILFEPGFYTTNVYSEQNVKFESPKHKDWTEIHEAIRKGVAAVDGNQPGDPVKAVERIIDVVRQEGMAAGKELPIRLPLGRDGLEQVRNKCLSTLKIIEEWESLIVSTDRDGAENARTYEHTLED